MLKLSLVLTVFILSGCEKLDKFWYPVEVIKITCGNTIIEGFKMKHSVGWRSWPYYIDNQKHELEITGNCCIIESVDKLNILKYDNRDNLSQIQKQYIIEGEL